MARVTIEDCINKVPNRFELVILATQRARELSRGSPPMVKPENDKNAVVALRELAERSEMSELVCERSITGLQTEIGEADEPEDGDVMHYPNVPARVAQVYGNRILNFKSPIPMGKSGVSRIGIRTNKKPKSGFRNRIVSQHWMDQDAVDIRDMMAKHKGN